MSESSAPPTESRGARDGAGGLPAPSTAGTPAAAPGGTAAPAHDPHGEHEEAHGFRVWRMTRPVVLAMSAACLAVFWFAGSLLHIPAHYGFEASLLQQPGMASKVLAVLVAAGLFMTCAVLVQLVAVRRWVLVGPFAAAIGLAAWSIRGGPSLYVYRRAGTAGYGTAVFPMLLLELVLLFAAVAAVWWMLLRRMEALAEETAAPAPAPAPRPAKGKAAAVADGPSLRRKVWGVLAQVAIIGVILFLLAATAEKAQVLASVLIASVIGTGLAEHYFKDQKLGPWLWAGPLLVGALGYLLNGATQAAVVATQTGVLTGTFAPLARPLPLDYASFGTAGALLGYWLGADKERLVGPGLVAAFGVGYFFLPDSIRNATSRPPSPARATAPPAPAKPPVPGTGQVG